MSVAANKLLLGEKAGNVSDGLGGVWRGRHDGHSSNHALVQSEQVAVPHHPNILCVLSLCVYQCVSVVSVQKVLSRTYRHDNADDELKV